MKIGCPVAFFCLTGILFLSLLVSCKKSDRCHEPQIHEVRLGAILDLSGIYSEEGMAGKVAMETGVADLNQLYLLAGSVTRFSVTVRDAGMDTAKALTAAKEMYNQGIRLLVGGPNTSSELKAIMPYLNANKMLVLNCFATSPALAIPDDYIFRLIPDDNVQGRATAKMMQTDGIKALIPVYRNDAYGTGLSQSAKDQFISLGGMVYDGVAYATGTVSYPDIISQAATQVADAVAIYGDSCVAVLLVSYQDAADFFKAATGVDVMKVVRWYGCDANTKKTAVTLDAEAAAFAHEVRFLAPIMAIGTASSVPPNAAEIAGRIKAVTGSDPDDMALSAYDAVMIYGQCYNLTRRYDATLFKAVLPSVCASYNYLGISRKMNDAGDLATSNYVFWAVIQTPGGWDWESYSTYFAEGDYILVKP